MKFEFKDSKVFFIHTDTNRKITSFMDIQQEYYEEGNKLKNLLKLINPSDYDEETKIIVSEHIKNNKLVVVFDKN